MTFGQQPRPGNNPYGNEPQAPYQQQFAAASSQQSYQANGQPGTPVIDAQTAYSYEQARKTSISRVYGEMTVGLIITAVVAVITQMTNGLYSFLVATNGWGWIGLAVVQVVMAVSIGARIMKMRPATARLLFYLYAALMGFTLSSIFMIYDLGSIGMTLGLTAGFFFALTMLSLTTKRDMLKAGPILFTALLVLIIGQVIMMFLAPSDTTIMVVSAIGLIIFAGLTAYDAQKTRALFAQFANEPDMIKRVSIICALNLYLDFVNMFLYLLQLVGNRN